MIHGKIPLLIWTIFVFKLVTSYPTEIQHEEARKFSSFSDENVSSQNMPLNVMNSDFYRKAAVENGMDPEAVAELIRTRNPIVKIENDENGMKRTTTYALQPDGSISRHIKTEYRPSLMNSIRPDVTMNTQSSLPNFSESASPALKESDWEWNPTSVPRFGTPQSRSDVYPQWTSNSNVPVFTYSQTPQVPTYWQNRDFPVKTDTFNGIDTKDAGTVTKTFVDGDNTKITTVHTVGPTQWHTKTVTIPWFGFDSTTTTTTTKRPKIVPPTLPSLEDFLNSQYGRTTKSSVEFKPIPNLFPQMPDTDTEPKQVTTINIEDLPIVKVLHNGKPSSDHVTATPNFTNKTTTYTRTFQSNGSPISSLDPNMKEILERAGIDPKEALASADGTVTKTRQDPDGKVITTTYRISTVPNGKNTVHAHPNDFSHIFGNELPQGPFFVGEPPRAEHEHTKSIQFPSINATRIPNGFGDFGALRPLDKNLQSADPSKHTNVVNNNPIDEFLAKLNLTARAITNSNGEIIKTIVDNNGRVLTASFVLSTVRNDDKPSKDQAQVPIK